jgi:hypothetical protein
MQPAATSLIATAKIVSLATDDASAAAGAPCER